MPGRRHPGVRRARRWQRHGDATCNSGRAARRAGGRMLSASAHHEQQTEGSTRESTDRGGHRIAQWRVHGDSVVLNAERDDFSATGPLNPSGHTRVSLAALRENPGTGALVPRDLPRRDPTCTRPGRARNGALRSTCRQENAARARRASSALCAARRRTSCAWRARVRSPLATTDPGEHVRARGSAPRAGPASRPLLAAVTRVAELPVPVSRADPVPG